MADYHRRWFAKRGPAAGCLVDLPLKPIGCGVELIESSATLAPRPPDLWSRKRTTPISLPENASALSRAPLPKLTPSW